MDNVIIYEQPLNETYRACLRLEQLFSQVNHLIHDTSLVGTRSITNIIIQILHLLDRPDLKAKLAKELTQQINLLGRLRSSPQADPQKLTDITQQLEELSRCFIQTNGKIGHNLREIELLNNLRMHLMTPGGGLSFDIPVHHYWLNQAPELRLATLQSWLDEFQPLRSAVELLLHLVRENTRHESKLATHGFYQELLDPQGNIKLIRVFISKQINAYPEVSVGRHFVSIRFYNPEITTRPTPFQQNITFGVAYCNA